MAGRPQKEGFLRSVEVLRQYIDDVDSYPFSIPALRDLERIDFDPSVTFLIGENVHQFLAMAERRWRRVNGAHLILLVRAGVRFADGIQPERRTAA